MMSRAVTDNEGRGLESRAIERLRRKVTVENLWIYVIKILEEEPLHAYGVKVRLRDRFGIKVATVTVYAVLYKMVREGLLMVERKGETKVYRPTEQGLRALSEARRILEDVLQDIGRPNEESDGGPAGI